jgi:soluble lytic murein transglycosylase-like protein/TolA-binding protein
MKLRPTDSPLILIVAAALATAALALGQPNGAIAQGDAALAAVRRLDQASRTSNGELAPLSAEEHMRRAAIYFANRAFAEARAHWQALITRYPNDERVPAALFGIGRSFYQERRYAEALPFFEKLGRDYPNSREGRDGFYFVAPTLLRLGRAAEAASRYQAYIARFPAGERIADAYLNTIDTLREAGKPQEALDWIERTRQKFAGTPTATNALFAHLRLEISRGNWTKAVTLSDELLRSPLTGTMTSVAEVNYLRAYSLERLGNSAEAARIYQLIPDSIYSYYGWLATMRLMRLGQRAQAIARASQVRDQIRTSTDFGETPYREIVLRVAKERGLDPRLILAIMRQESAFRPQARSRAAARGLMQLTIDIAQKYGPRANLSEVGEMDLYRPEISIQIAAAYLAELTKLFPQLPEAVVASYNGGEDNVARWLERSGKRDPGLFTAEIGFAETKDYVFKVMNYYRAYCTLYTAELLPQRPDEAQGASLPEKNASSIP